ncbi:P-loop containing nucleoside triphosphate hydrolase protein [Aspergillus spectabilis]
MKSGEHRDNLVKLEGVIGFEMEGAGVWNNISCVIIKGVCDYADSHKNKAWQAYAAATGAATAKAFLEYWEPVMREEANKFHIQLDLTAVPAIEEFVGRDDELRGLWDYLQPWTSRTRKVAVLHGLGGIGKTQLAIHFARKHQTDFTAIFWLNGKDRSALLVSLSSCLTRILGQPMNINPTNEEEAEQRAGQVLKWLVMPGNTRWLIIFDNINQYIPAREHDDCGYDIYKFFPKADHGSIIITSRLQGLTELGKSFVIQKLIRKDATQQLLQSSGFLAEEIARMGAEQDMINLANLLDGLSLAIVIAGAFMRQTGINFKEYLEFYQTSWVNLQSQSNDPTAASLLLLLALFDNQDIWYELIESGMNCSDPPAWFETAVSSKLVFKTKLKALIEFSLVETKQHEGSYSLHPVGKLKEAEEMYQQALAGCEKSLGPDHTSTLDTVHNLSLLYYNQSKLKEAEDMFQRALAGYKKALGPDHISTLDTVNNLGSLYSAQGKLKEAEEIYQQVLAGYEKALGPDHTSTLDTVHNLGLLYYNQGKLKETEAWRQRGCDS